MFTAAQFTLARTWKQPRCPMTNESMKKVRYVYATEYYSATKRSQTGSFVEMWMDLESVTEWSKSEREKQISYIDAYRWNLEKWYIWTYLQSRNRNTDVENKCTDTKEGEGGWDELRHWDRHIHSGMYEIGLVRASCIAQGTLHPVVT